MGKVTEVLPDGSVRVTDFPQDSITPDNTYYFTAADGWKQWIIKQDVEGGGYWRAFSNDALISELEVLKQQAIGALASRAVDNEQTK